MSRLPLRARVMVWFGLVSLLLTTVLAVSTWLLTSGYMIGQRERSAIGQANSNARLVESTLRSGSAGLADLLTGLGAGFDSAVLLVNDGEWINTSNTVDPKQLPEQFLRTVQEGTAAHQRTVLDGVPVLAVGLPLPDAGATYVEVSPLRELDRTLRFISTLLVTGVAASAIAGAVLGRWVATYALRPLRALTAAAAKAAAGDLTARLPPSRDPDLRPLATAFNSAAERLQARVARDARFAGDVSHELRSPLTTMLNAMAVLARRRADMPVQARQAVDLLDTELHRFRHMVEDLLEISRDDDGRDSSSLECVDFAELVREATAQHPAPDSSCLVDSPDHPMVIADRRRLERVVANLVANADLHGGGAVRLGVSLHDGRARLEVDDAGPGVDEADRERVFERFARGAPGSRETSDTGVGLGLALVSQHVRRHAGRVWVEDRPGGGARFIVEIPAVTP